MSLGPTKKENFGISAKDKIQFAVKKTIAGYFEKPLFYLFYIMLPGTILGLVFNQKFPIDYYVIFAALAGIEMYRYFTSKPEIHGQS